MITALVEIAAIVDQLALFKRGHIRGILAMRLPSLGIEIPNF